MKIFPDNTAIFISVSNLPDWENCWKILITCLTGVKSGSLAFIFKKTKLHIGSNNKQFSAVTFHCNLTFEHHITDIINKAQLCLGCIHRYFEHLDNDMFLHLYKSLVRPTLEYGSCIWSQYLKKDIRGTENI